LLVFRKNGFYGLRALGLNIENNLIGFGIILGVILVSVRFYAKFYIGREKELYYFKFIVLIFRVRIIILIFSNS